MNICSKTPYRQTTLAVALVAAVCSASAIAMPDTGTQVTVGHATALRRGEAVVGPVAMEQPIHIVVALQLRHRATLDAFIAAMPRNRVNGVQQPMNLAQYLADHAPTQEQAQAVADYLTRKGYRNVAITPDRLLVSADGSAATARDAFGTSFAQVRAEDGRMAYANTDDVRIPVALRDSVLSVLGLQTLHQARTPERVAASKAAVVGTRNGHAPVEFPSIYDAVGIPGGPFGPPGPQQEHMPVALIAEGDIRQTIADLDTFISRNGLPALEIQTVRVGGTSSDTSHTVEWDLDSQTILGTGGGTVGPIRFYVAPSLGDADLTADIDAAAALGYIARQDGYAPVIDVAVGECELDAQDSGAAAAQDQIFAIAVSQNRTFAVATGDSGSNECGDGRAGASWPAASQYVVAVGGTTLDASTTTWSGETVWSASGGGPSRFEPKPIWQAALVPGSRRVVPDVAFDADPESGASIVVDGHLLQVGGTGLAASIFTGLWSRALIWPGGNIVSYKFPFAGPNLYLLPQANFHDITVGNNGGYRAGAGYDFASGRGSLDLGAAISQLGNPVGNPPDANFSFDVIDGLRVKFTDQSTDSDGSITGHSWNFNDGSPIVSATNPIHTFLGAGNFTVNELVSDNDGNIVQAEQTLTVAAPGLPNQRIVNSGFETGSLPWIMSPGVWCTPEMGLTCRRPYLVDPHEGNNYALLDGYGQAHTDTLEQEITLPASGTSATLAFWLQVNSEETTTSKANDQLTVGVYNARGQLLGTLATFSNLDLSFDYQLHTCDMTPWMGQSVWLRFTGKENASLATSFAIDDVTVQVK